MTNTEARLSEAVGNALGDAVTLWAEEHLPGRPAILGAAVFAGLERELLRQQAEIEMRFPL